MYKKQSRIESKCNFYLKNYFVYLLVSFLLLESERWLWHLVWSLSKVSWCQLVRMCQCGADYPFWSDWYSSS